MRVFVTGGTGYIGLALCRRLAADGHELTALVRPTSRTAPLEELGVELFRGDITDRYSMREGMSGADWVVHAAAVIDFGAGGEQMHRVNVEGSDNVASLAYKLGVGRLLELSSMAAFGGSPEDGGTADEESPPMLPFPGAYCATKHAGSRAVAAWAERGLAVNTLYPGLVYGPPTKRSGANALLWRVAAGRLPMVVGGERTSRWIHIDDLVEAIVRVMARAEPGAHYLVTGAPITTSELVAKVCALAGRRPPRLRLSPWAAGVLVVLAAPLFRLRGRRPPLARDELLSIARNWNFDDAKARRELDWRPRELEQGLPETVEHLLGR